MLLPVLSILLFSYKFVHFNATNSSSSSERRIYFLKKCNGAGCPYTASWLSHINLYRRVGWAMESTKMESASFNMFDFNRYFMLNNLFSKDLTEHNGNFNCPIPMLISSII
jgi:hypothetical protein